MDLPENKLLIGTRVRILQGRPMWMDKTTWAAEAGSEQKPKHLLYETDTAYVVDLNPDLVGKEKVIQDIDNDSYALSNPDGTGKLAWFIARQLEVVT